MLRTRLSKFLWITFCVMPLVAVQTSAQAGVIGAEQFLNEIDRRAAIDRIDAVLARDDVRAQLERHGVDPMHAAERAAALNDQELMQLADEIEQLPAGGLLGTIGVVFVVLLILELTGVINIFNRI